MSAPVMAFSALDPTRLAQSFRAAPQGHSIRYWKGEWWQWKAGRYVTLPKDAVRAALHLHIQFLVTDQGIVDSKKKLKKVTRGIVADALAALEAIVTVSPQLEQPVWLGPEDEVSSENHQYFAFPNGLVEVNDLLRLGAAGAQVQEPSTRWFSPTCFTFEYDPDAECPLWQDFLEEILEQDQERIALLQEYIGYCLTHDTRMQAFMVFEGEGANGKSVVLETIASLLGHDNISAVHLGLFGKRFDLLPTLGKLANIAPEIDDTRRVPEAELKQFVSGEPMYFDVKGRQGFTARPTAKIIMATNQRPEVLDRSKGVWRRMLLVPFRVTIAKEKQDKQLATKLRGELAGIFNWAVEGLRRLRQQQQFTKSQLVEDATEEYRKESNPVKAFAEEYLTADEQSSVLSQEVYGAYTQWFKRQGYPVGKLLPAHIFGKELKKQFPAAEVVREPWNGRKVTKYKGLALAGAEESLDDVGF